MSTPKKTVFHLAIPCRDLHEAKVFYVDRLGARLARTYDDHITLDFFGDQLVCHLAPDKIEPTPQLYPRHFGVTFRARSAFEGFSNRMVEQEMEFFKQPFIRFEGMQEEHVTFFLKDPSNNLIEFKYYKDERMMY